MKTAHDHKGEVSSYAILVHQRGWAANHDGNVSVRLDKAGKLLITPTATSKRKCSPESIVLVESDGKPGGSGPRKGKPPGELNLHMAAYQARPDVHAVIHAHPPQASAFALAARAIEPVAMPEVVVSLGDKIPLLPLFLPKDPRAPQAVADALAIADVMLLSGNGVLVVGSDLEQAFLRLELLEHYARILAAAGPIGGPKPLDAAVIAQLLEQRRAAGLGPQTAAKPAAVVSKPTSIVPSASSVRAVVEDELKKALGGRR